MSADGPSFPLSPAPKLPEQSFDGALALSFDQIIAESNFGFEGSVIDARCVFHLEFKR